MLGFLIVDKPSGLTSHDVVMQVRRGTRIKQIGHAGTLDPMATGVLVLCMGDATRLSEYVMSSSKIYRATLRLGIETDSYDADGQATVHADPAQLDAITREQFTASLAPFIGTIGQIPPMYSAIKQDGVRLYKLARAGEEVERAPRTVTIDSITLLDWQPPSATIEITCGAGTYIRSLAHDIGAALGVGAHLTALRRVQSGALGDPVDWQMLLDSLRDKTWERFLIDETLPLGSMPLLTVDEAQAGAVWNGNAIDLASFDSITPDDPQNAPLYRLYDSQKHLIAIAEIRTDRLQPVKVFHHGNA